MGRISFLLHNLVMHPVAGFLWFIGLEGAGDFVHSFGEPPEIEAEPSLPSKEVADLEQEVELWKRRARAALRANGRDT